MSSGWARNLRASLATRVILTLACLGLGALLPSGVAAQTVVRSIAQSADDAEQRVSSGVMSTSGSILDIPFTTVEQIIGFRFQDITIPAGALITSAEIQMQAYSVRPDVAVTMTIVGEDIDDAPAFTTTAYDITDRTQTTASETWVMPHWDTANERAADQLSPDFSDVVQEIVDRSGWASGNDIVIMLELSSGTGDREAYSYDSDNTKVAEITITFTSPGGRVWMTTTGDVATSGTPGITDWGEDDVLEFFDPNLVFEPTDTDGTFSFVFGVDDYFDDGVADLAGLHYVTRNMTIASGANDFHLKKGDVLFTLEADEVIGDTTYADNDVHVFRPDSPGDYSSGSIYFLIDELSQYDTRAITLVEYDTFVGDQQLYAGEFLYSDSFHDGKIHHFAPTGVGEGTTSGTKTVFLDGADGGAFNITAKVVGIELIEQATTIGGQTLAVGTILASVGVDDSVGDPTSLSVADEDIFQLDVSTTYMNASSSSATASKFMDSDLVFLSATEEDIVGFTVWAPPPEMYRSSATGNWSAAGTWERYRGTSWIAASAFPTETDSTITILSGHTVTVDSGVGDSLRVDETTIASGGTMVVDHKTLVVDGTSTDLTVAGTLTINASKEFNPTGSSTVSVTGTVTNNGTFNADGTSTVTFASGSTYDHSQNGGAFPQAARTTWSSGSTATVTGVTTTLPTELGDSFHHFIWNSASQTAALDLNHAMAAIGGNFTMTSTGSGSLSWVLANSTALSIGGNYVQTGGTFIYADGFTVGTMSATDVSVTGGTLNLSSGTGLPTLDIDDDLVVSGGGTITETGTGSGIITFTGSAQQDVTAASGITNDIDITVNNTGGILLLSDLSAPADLTATAGDIDAGGYDIYVGADLTISTDLTNGAAVIFNGASGNQNVTYSPGTWSIASLDVNKAAGSLLLGTDVTVTTTSCLTSGTLDVNGQTLTFPTGTTLYNGGTVTGNVVFERNYALVGDGWRMIASPLDGVNYSSLNTNFHTQGATWADFSGGSATLQSADFAAQDWTEITGADANFTAAEGYIFYMYEELLGSTILPATWSVTGTVRTSANKSLSWNTVSTDSYNYVGNRTTGNIDWDAAYAASTNVATTYSTWDPALTAGGGLTGYKYYNEATGTGLAGRYIAPFTAFMVEPTASGGTLVFSTSCADNEASANYFGKRSGGQADSTAREISPHVRLMVEGEGHAELETYLVFDDRATDGADPFDGNRMRPLSRDYVTLVSIQEDRTLVFDGRSMVEGTQEYTLGVAATQPGVYTLTWPDWHEIPEAWRVTLYDRADGRRVDLRDQEAFTFYIDEADTTPHQSGQPAHIDATPRFNVRVTNEDVVFEKPEPLPESVALAQNYPNPFNPVTTIRYALPEEAPVRLEVFDMLGRRVSLLVDGTESPGWKEVRWDAGNLPSGLYLYRLAVGSQQHVNSMMLLR